VLAVLVVIMLIYQRERRENSSDVMKHVYTCCGLACLGLAFVGIFLPLLPTTPLVILAAFCFSKGSKTLHRWLLSQPLFGPVLEDWQAHHVIRFHVKCIATSLIAITMSYPVFFGPLPLWVRISLVGIMAFVLRYIWSFPSESKSVRAVGLQKLEHTSTP
jgi:uncharacterized membrane protein YbaN (DUF454 family)